MNRKTALLLSITMSALCLAPGTWAQRTVRINTYECPGQHSAVALGTMRVPKDRADDFIKAACAVTRILYSEAFRKALQEYIAAHAGEGAAAGAWSDWKDADKIVAELKKKVGGIPIVTYGGPHALYLLKAYGNLAYEGSTEGPIRLNRPGLKGRSYSSIANSIIHEVAHRAGMSHPHSNDRFSVAVCEPPYVIGSIMEKLLEGPSWNPAGDCIHLK